MKNLYRVTIALFFIGIAKSAACAALDGATATYIPPQNRTNVSSDMKQYTFSPIMDPSMSKGFRSGYQLWVYIDTDGTEKTTYIASDGKEKSSLVNQYYSPGLCPKTPNTTCTWTNPAEIIDRFTVHYTGVLDRLNRAIVSGRSYLHSACFFQEHDWEEFGRPGSSVWGGKNCGQIRLFKDAGDPSVNSFALTMNSSFPYARAAEGSWLIKSPSHPEMKVMQEFMWGSGGARKALVPPLSQITSFRVSFKAKLEYVSIEGCRATSAVECNGQEAIHAGVYLPVQYLNWFPNNKPQDQNHGKVISIGASLFDSRDNHSAGINAEGYVKRQGMRKADLDPTMKNAIVHVPRADQSSVDHFTNSDVLNFPSLSYPAEAVNGPWVTVDYDFLPAMKEAIAIEARVKNRVSPFNETKSDGSYRYKEYFHSTESPAYDWIESGDLSHFFPAWISFWIEASRKGVVALQIKDMKVEVGVNENL